MTNYWSNSRIADLIRGRKKIDSGTSEQWQNWELVCKDERPIRFWISETGLDGLQDFLYWPYRRFRKVKNYLHNRFVSQTHALVANKKNLKRGQWCDVSHRFLPCMFDTLVDFVETETAWMEIICNKDAAKKYNISWWQRHFGGVRSAEAGIAHLEWAAALTYGESDFCQVDDPDFGKPTPQAVAAKEVLELYRWYTEVYPNRPDPYEVSGFQALCDAKREECAAEGISYWVSSTDRTPEETKKWRKATDKMVKIEKAYQKEDTQMLIRLVKTRDYLWT